MNAFYCYSNENANILWHSLDDFVKNITRQAENDILAKRENLDIRLASANNLIGRAKAMMEELNEKFVIRAK